MNKGRESLEKRRIQESMFLLAPSPCVSDSPMDDLWRELSSRVIGRHVGSQCGNESMRDAAISQDYVQIAEIFRE